MRRKIVQHGSSSLTITLPFSWVKTYNLKKGDELNVEVEGPKLSITTHQPQLMSKKSVESTDFGLFTRNNLTHLYQDGYDEIEIKFNDADELNGIKQHMPECIGFEIIDQKNNRLFIKSIAHTMDSDFDVLLRKSFLVTNELAENVLDALKKREFSRLAEISNLESLNNKFTNCCNRIIMKQGYSNPRRIPQIYSLVKMLERIADEYKYICNLYKDFDGKIDKDLLEYFKTVNELYLTFYKMFYKFDPELKKKIYLDGKRLLSKGESMLSMSKGKNSLLLHYLLNVIRKTNDASGAYFALML